jgi:hypothetical protein
LRELTDNIKNLKLRELTDNFKYGQFELDFGHGFPRLIIYFSRVFDKATRVGYKVVATLL